MKTLQRQSNIELFRIIVMLSIVAHHFVVNSGLLGLMSPTMEVANDVYLWLFGMWGKIGINCFVLITGYFMCTSQFTWRKFIKLVCEIDICCFFIVGERKYFNYKIFSSIMSHN